MAKLFKAVVLAVMNDYCSFSVVMFILAHKRTLKTEFVPTFILQNNILPICAKNGGQQMALTNAGMDATKE
jgi:hypothetical protein